MSEFTETAASWRRLCAAWRTASFDVRLGVVMAMIGEALITTAIVYEFGWSGAVFVFGWFLKAVYRK